MKLKAKFAYFGASIICFSAFLILLISILLGYFNGTKELITHALFVVSFGSFSIAYYKFYHKEAKKSISPKI